MSDLPPGWEWVPLGEVGEWSGGGTPSKSNSAFWVDGTVPWISPKDISAPTIVKSTDHITKCALVGSAVRLIPPNSVVIVVRSGILERTVPTAIVPFATTINQDLKALTPHPGISYKWIAHCLRALEGNILGTCRKLGTTVASIDVPRLMQLRIPLAPLAEQRRIVFALEEYLSCLDVGTRIVDESPQRQQQLDSCLLEYAVTGKLSTPMATDGSASKLIEQSQSLVSGYYKPRPATARRLPDAASRILGKATIPISWKWAEWGQLGLSKNGAPFPSSDYQQGGVRLIRPGNLDASGFVSWASSGTTKNLPESYARKHPSLIVPAGSLIMNLTAQSLKDNFLGRTCMKLDPEPALLNQRLAWLKPVLMSRRYLWLVFRSPLFRKFVNRLNSGSLIQHIHTWQVEKFIVPVPPLEEQMRIIARHEELSSRIKRGSELACASTKRIDVLGKMILAEAFSGRLVPQDPSDEPVAVLLERIKAGRATQPRAKRARRTAKNADPEQESML